MGERNIVLDCSLDRISAIFNQAEQVGMMTMSQSYFITSLVRTNLSLSQFRSSFCLICEFTIQPKSEV